MNSLNIPSILYTQQNEIAIITLNRPSNLNAIDTTMPGLLKSSIEKANLDNSIKIILLTGSGSKYFLKNPLNIIKLLGQHFVVDMI